MSTKGKVVRIDFFTVKNLPARLKQEAERQNTDLGNGLIAVKTSVSSSPSYEFEPIGSKPVEVQAYMAKLANQDGVELGVAVKKALSPE